MHAQITLNAGFITLRLFEDSKSREGSPAIVWIFQQRILQGCANKLPGVLARRRL